MMKAEDHIDFNGVRIVSDYSGAVEDCADGAAPAPSTSACAACGARGACVGNMLHSGAEHVLPLIGRRRVKRGDVLYRSGEAFRFTYAVRSGTFKSSIPLADGRDQVTGFHFAGELMGVDGLATGRHITTTVALEEGNVCTFPFALLNECGENQLELRRRLLSVMAMQLLRQREMLTLLANSTAEQRIAAFLLGLGDRMSACGWSPREFHLRMRRADIASQLGMTVETVSRTLTALADQGVLSVQKKHIRVLQPERLEQQAPPAMRSPAFGEVSLV
jgi:CRP/FNR family transcriptional regulator